MMMQKSRVSIFIFLFAGFFLSAQTIPPRRPPLPNGERVNMNGRRMQKRTERFSLIGVKTEDSGDFLTVSFFFNEPVDANSVRTDAIFINDDHLPNETDFIFSKTRRMVRFSLAKQSEPFLLRVTDVRSYDGRLLDATEIPNLEADSFFKCSRKEQTWKKS